ncbi:hypothetical protein ANSO36C_56760 [Nostoc cf. commune SO-36]|uniref:PAC domain-containing protein n=1 Tax=Nostoc cf. commune SO-36 TaxID=449208 RepID=A0ABN6QBS7_NOSCO|nr:hypothetical protein [Nostoc commune]BDI19874.1 hypothetical protein ANSO36C_56760 [Nostoc cf. commune SO-36]
MEPVKAVFEQLVTDQLPNEYENYWLMKNGSRRLIAWSNTILKDYEDCIEYIVVTGTDITDVSDELRLRKRAQKHLTAQYATHPRLS